MSSKLRNAFFLVIAGIVSLYAGLAALGAFDPTESVGATAAVAALALIWMAYGVFAHLHHADIERDPSLRYARERRGF
jgi:hypothetical protein